MAKNQVFPTKGNLLAFKKTDRLAKLGYDLIDRKRNILIHEMMQLIESVRSMRNEITEVFQTAYEALQEANITLGIVGDIAKTVPIDNGLTISYRSVMGVDIPKLIYEKAPVRLNYGFASTNTKFDYAYQNFLKVRDLVVKLAEIDNSAYRLAYAIRKAQKRANALKNIVIPDLEEDIKFIADSLEEKEREEFSRLKMIKREKHE